MKPHFKPISPHESKLFNIVVQKNEKDFEYPWHYHPEYELTYIPSGHGVRYVGSDLDNFYPDDLVLIGSNLPHSWVASSDQNLQSRAIVIYLRKEFLETTWVQSFEFDGIRKLLKLSNKGIKFDRSVAIRMREKYNELVNLTGMNRLILLIQILQDLAMTNKFHLLCDHEFSTELNHSNNERINKVYKFVENNYNQQVLLADVAAKVNMSSESFSRFFSKIMKKPFFEFLNGYKINKACKLLIETDKRVSEICYDSGFQSIPFFYKQFKKIKNCSPNLYRKNYRKNFDFGYSK